MGDECATNNGGCGDAKFYSCTNNDGAAPSCADINECATNNGGCGDCTCTNNDGAAPTCTCTTTPCPTTTTPCPTTTTPCPTTTTPCATTTTPCATTTAASPCDTTANFIGKYASKQTQEGERLRETKAGGALSSVTCLIAASALVCSAALFVRGQADQ